MANAAGSAICSTAISSKYDKWSLVAMLWMVSFFNYADRSTLNALIPQIKSDFGLSNTEIGLLSTSFLWVYAIAASPAGWLGDNVSRKLVVLGGLLLWSLVTVLTPFAGGLAAIVVFRALTGLGEAGYYPSGTALISDFHGPETRSRALAIHQTAVFAGGGIGTYIAAMLAERYDWHMPYYVYGGLGILLAAVLLVTMKDTPPHQKQSRSETKKSQIGSIWIVLRTPSGLILCLVFFFATFVTAGISAWAPAFFNLELNLSLSQATIYGAATVNIAGFLAVLCSGFISDWAVKRTKAARFYVLAVGLLLAGLALLPFGQFRDPTMLGILLLCAGFFKGIFDGSIYAAMHDVVAPCARSTAVGLMTTIGFAGAGLAPLVIGFASSSIGLGQVLAMTAVMHVIAAAILIGFRPQIIKDIMRLPDN